MGSSKRPEPQPVQAVAAAPKARALEVNLAQAEAELLASKKRGARSNIYAGARSEVKGAEVLG